MRIGAESRRWVTASMQTTPRASRCRTWAVPTDVSSVSDALEAAGHQTVSSVRAATVVTGSAVGRGVPWMQMTRAT